MKLLKRFFILLLAAFAVVYIWAAIYSIDTPLVSRSIAADTNRIKKDLHYLTKECRYRNFLHPAQLQKAAEHIQQEFLDISPAVALQPYSVGEEPFMNVICSLGPRDAERIIVGAHYDACLDQEGADDNASGVAGLLELGRLLKKETLRYRVDLVAYSTEEPPFFGTQNMGSYIHAKSLFDQNIAVKGMICLEMMGVYFDAPGTQDYPVFFLEWFYGNRGNFITVVQKFFNGSFGESIRKQMKKEPVIPVKSFTAPSWAAGVGLSDHVNYWEFGYSAVMITNTAFYRNKRYHTEGDRLEKLDVQKMSLVIDQLYRTLLAIQQ